MTEVICTAHSHLELWLLRQRSAPSICRNATGGYNPVIILAIPVGLHVYTGEIHRHGTLTPPPKILPNMGYRNLGQPLKKLKQSILSFCGSYTKTVPALDSWRPPQIQLWGPVFNIQGKITVHFHTRVYIHTGQAQWQYCKWGFGLPHQLGVWGSAVSSPSGVRGRAPATNRFFAFWCAQNGSPTQHEAPEHAWGPPPRPVGTGGSSSGSVRMTPRRTYTYTR